MFRPAAVALALLIAVPAAAAPAAAKDAPAFVQLDGRVMFPLGDWSDNFSWPEQTQFSPGPAGLFGFGWAPLASRYFTVGLEAGYTQVGTSEWEEFTASRGSRVDAAARMWSVMAGGSVSLPGRGSGAFAAELRGALGVLVPSGEERFRGAVVDYDFLRTTIAGRVGGRFVWRLDPFDLWAGADLLVAPGAVQHQKALPSADAPLVRSLERRSIVALEPGFGLRYWFGL